MLSNKEICVYNGSKEYSKAELEKLIVKFGGKVVQNPGKKDSWFWMSVPFNVPIEL